MVIKVGADFPSLPSEKLVGTEIQNSYGILIEKAELYKENSLITENGRGKYHYGNGEQVIIEKKRIRNMSFRDALFSHLIVMHCKK